MPYARAADLPAAVKKLPSHAQAIWRAAFNSAHKQYQDEQRSFAVAWAAVKRDYTQDADGNWHAMKKGTLAIPISKADDARQCVFGYASVAVTKDGETLVDLQGDTIAIEDLEDAWYSYVKESGELNFHHAGAIRGYLIESIVFTPEKLAKMGIPPGTVPLAAWVGYHIPDPVDYAQAREEGLFMFSIEGLGQREDVTP